MSIKVMSYIWDHYTGKSAKKLMLLAIADHADDYGTAFPGVSRLADKCSVDQRTAQRTINNLVREGELAVDEQNGIKTSHGFTNRYFIVGYRRSVGITSENLENAKTPPPPPKKKRGDKNTTPPRGDKNVTSRGDKNTTRGVTKTSPKPSVEPSVQPSVIDERVVHTYEQYVGGTLSRTLLDNLLSLVNDYSEQTVINTLQRAGHKAANMSYLNACFRDAPKVNPDTQAVYDALMTAFRITDMTPELHEDYMQTAHSLRSIGIVAGHVPALYGFVKALNYSTFSVRTLAKKAPDWKAQRKTAPPRQAAPPSYGERLTAEEAARIREGLA